MKRNSYLVLLVLTAALAFLAGTWYNRAPASANSLPGGRKILYYTDPMHPAYRSDKPGTAPDCGMQLEPVYAAGRPAGGEPERTSPPPGAIRLTAERQQLGGVRVGPVETASGGHVLRLLGRVAPDEARTYRLNAGTDGFIQQVSPVTTGSRVVKDQLLATFSSPSSLMILQTYVLNLGAEDRYRKSAAAGSPEAQNLPSAAANIQQRIQQLENLGMSALQIDEIRRTREVPDRIKVVSPADGFVLARNVWPGQKFDRGAEWYRIADLARVWVLADVFSNDAEHLRPGARASVTLPNQRRSVPARVSEILPQFDAATRTLKVRLEMDNPGYALRPDMFVDVELPIALPPAIAVPADAVLDSGLMKTVFVDLGDGYFDPRRVETGWRSGDRVAVVKGLEPGERIVISGTFLLDSESRMKQPAAGAANRISAAVRDPICGMSLDAGQVRYKGEFGGEQYFFCSRNCRHTFDQDPAGSLAKARHRDSRAGPRS